ncbi:hypothetical protein LH128_01137 [Sphingomonas sp. LH128]|uniref:portal protein n=1 Tax=Sphingomonas sp. LH128 TaxID=473781 RepID=UPI00027CC1FB|nr:portal protein [Sphingomonas sp. LH128]EJU14937.1 hypothetical protein LH128_01137 [Sphingomonas sp. LH128]
MTGLREHCQIRLEALKGVRSDYEAEWRDIARFAQPARSRFLASEQNKGTRRRVRNSRLLDPHGIESFRTLANGMTSGLTPSSAPWFTLKLASEELNELPGVRAWLSDCEKAMYAFLARTNFYAAAKSGYSEMGLFGTEACVMVEHNTAGAVSHALTAGEYWIGLSDALTPDTLARECTMTARQMVQAFKGKAPKLVYDAYTGKRSDEVFTYYNLIEPNLDFDPRRFGSKPWRSLYWLPEAPRGEMIDVRGYNEQPFWAPRWGTVGGDTYGGSPGMESLPALRELQFHSKRLNEATDKLVKPEMLVKQGIRVTGEPGAVRSVVNLDQYAAMPAYSMPYQVIAAIEGKIDKIKLQVDSASYADLFNAITNMRGIQPRNIEEIASRNEEKLTQLGPTIDSVNGEKLHVAIDRVWGIMLRGGLLPPAPAALAEMGGAAIVVEFVSILARMQRAVGAGQIERALGMVGNLAAAAPDVLDNVNTDEALREYYDRLGVPGRILRDPKDVEAIRAGRAQQQQMAQAAAMMPAVRDGADAARLLSETDISGRPALDAMIGA